MPATNLGKVSITPKGDYAADVTYEALDLVYSIGESSSYLAIKPSIGIALTDEEYWMLISSGSQGAQGLAATISVGATTTAKPDVPASVENVGTENDAILNFSIPKGEKGDTGKGLDIRGYFDTESELRATDPDHNYMYGVGLLEPYDIWDWDDLNGGWVNIGKLQGAKGDKGDKGEQGAKGDTGEQGPPVPILIKTALLTFSDWTGIDPPFEQTISVEGVTESTAQVVEVGLFSSASLHQREIARSAQLFATGKALNQITVVADGDKPIIDLPIEIVIID